MSESVDRRFISISWSNMFSNTTVRYLCKSSNCLPTFMPSIIKEKSWKFSCSPGEGASVTNGSRSITLKYLPQLALKLAFLLPRLGLGLAGRSSSSVAPPECKERGVLGAVDGAAVVAEGDASFRGHA